MFPGNPTRIPHTTEGIPAMLRESPREGVSEELRIQISFLAHLMCYCCRKLDFQWNLRGRVGGRGSLWEAVLSDWQIWSRTLWQSCLIQSGTSVREAEVWGCVTPWNSDSLAHGLSHFVMWSIRCAIDSKSLISCLHQWTMILITLPEKVWISGCSNLNIDVPAYQMVEQWFPVMRCLGIE